jgi:twitching motility protein PilT
MALGKIAKLNLEGCTLAMEINAILEAMVGRGASDLHLKVFNPPVFRIDGIIKPQADFPVIMPSDIDAIFDQITSLEQKNAFARDLELDFAYGVPKLARFRVNVLQQRGSKGLCLRHVLFKIPTIDELNLPAICKELILRPRGLVLVTSPTGSGKTTTMAAMVDYLNDQQEKSVLTMEDPIEFLHRDKKCIINQRDLGDDTRSFAMALTHALRHNPDVIIVGEMRDLETISIAIKAAETGHLVLSTLHTTDAAQTVDRIIDSFPPDQQRQIKLQLAQVLEGILAQALCRKIEKGRVAAIEILVGNAAVRNLIREGKTHELASIMQLSSKEGMVTLNQALSDLVNTGQVSAEEALSKSSNPKQLKSMIHTAISRAPLKGPLSTF